MAVLVLMLNFRWNGLNFSQAPHYSYLLFFFHKYIEHGWVQGGSLSTVVGLGDYSLLEHLALLGLVNQATLKRVQRLALLLQIRLECFPQISPVLH